MSTNNTQQIKMWLDAISDFIDSDTRDVDDVLIFTTDATTGHRTITRIDALSIGPALYDHVQTIPANTQARPLERCPDCGAEPAAGSHRPDCPHYGDTTPEYFEGEATR